MKTILQIDTIHFIPEHTTSLECQQKFLKQKVLEGNIKLTTLFHKSEDSLWILPEHFALFIYT